MEDTIANYTLPPEQQKVIGEVDDDVQNGSVEAGDGKTELEMAPQVGAGAGRGKAKAKAKGKAKAKATPEAKSKAKRVAHEEAPQRRVRQKRFTVNVS